MNAASPLRILIVDDEPLARQRILDLLEAVPDVEIIGTAGRGRDAVQAIRSQAPDIVFLDVQMPGMTGLDVIREVGPDAMPTTVFVTAYDQHALDAFDLAAIDYLLKPFEDERFRQTLERARRAVRLAQVEQLQSRMFALLEGKGVGTTQPPERGYRERIAVEMRGQVRVVAVERIDYIAADGPYAELHAGSDKYIIREKMQTLEEGLDPAHFLRIHRSTIVQIDRIESLLVGAGGDYAVRLSDGTRLRVSRGRYDDLVARLGLNPAK